MSNPQLDDLLYPREAGSREERLKRLRQVLNDPAARTELADYLARRQRDKQAAQDNADAFWQRAELQDEYEGTEDELAVLSRQLALSLGAKTPRSLPLPLRLWAPALVGLVFGILATWMALAMLPQLLQRPHGSFAAALESLVRAEQPDSAELRTIDILLEQYSQSVTAGGPEPPVAISGKVEQLLREYQPDQSEIVEARKLLGVYTPPG